MSRTLGVRLGLILFGLIALFLLWSFAYPLVVALRFDPSLPGEGQSRWALLQQINGVRDFSALTIGPQHFLERFNYPPTQLETLIRGGIAAGGVIALGVGLGIFAWAIRKPAPYGSSRFGTLLEAEKKGLTAKRGLILGKLGGQQIVSDDPAHVLVVGPTRSGKGVSFIVPNGFAWEGSSVWFDPKRENFGIFGAYREAIGDKVFMFSPGENDSHRYNPLDFIRRDERMPTDAMVVASFIVPDATGSSEIWSRSARLLLQAMIGYVIASPRYEGRRHLRAVSRMTTTGVDFLTVLKGLVANEGNELPLWVVDGFNQFIVIEKETRNSALFNLNTALNPWNSDLVAAATSRSDFDIRELRREKMAIFIGCSVAQLDVYRPIIKILVQQIHDVLMAKIPGPDEPHKVLVMIDEFRQLGRMDALVSKLTINAGYGFRMVLVLQDVGQLDEVYSKPTRITTMSACQVKLFIQINDQETAEYVSDMLGSTTMEIKTPLPRPGQSVFSNTKQVRYEERAFRTPEELRRMNQAKSILLVPNSYGFELSKYRYFADQPFKRMLQAASQRKMKLPRLNGWVDKAPDGIKSASAMDAAAKALVTVVGQPVEFKPTPKQAEAEARAEEWAKARRAGIGTVAAEEPAKSEKLDAKAAITLATIAPASEVPAAKAKAKSRIKAAASVPGESGEKELFSIPQDLGDLIAEVNASLKVQPQTDGKNETGVVGDALNSLAQAVEEFTAP